MHMKEIMGPWDPKPPTLPLFSGSYVQVIFSITHSDDNVTVAGVPKHCETGATGTKGGFKWKELKEKQE